MRDYKEEYRLLSPEAKARKSARNQLPHVKQQKRDYYQREKLAIKERYESNIALAVEALEEKYQHKGCMVCGTTDRLEFDHINPEEKSFDPRCRMNVVQMSERQWEEIFKCQLLCYDCHKEKTKQSLLK